MDSFKGGSQRIEKREVSTKKNHLISIFKNFEVTIVDKKKKYLDKLQSLLSAWEQIGTFISETSTESPQPEFDSLFLHTLRLVLRADWKYATKPTKTHLSNILQRIASELSAGKRFTSILPQCRVLESIINDPWDHSVLKKIFQDETIEIDELIDYFHFENGKVIVVRLEILLENKCEDLATRLSKACLMTFNLTDPLELDLNQNEVDYITDIYLCGLYRAKNKKDLIAELKTFDITDGLQLLQRYNKQGGVGNVFNNTCKDARIWKCSRQVMELISSTLLANAVLQDNFAFPDIDILHGLIQEWASVHTTSLNDIFSPVTLEMIWKCVLIARSSMCIYPFCSFLMECGGKQHDLNHLLRCLIRAINQNMNEIEQHRVCRNNEKLKFSHDLLAKGFLLTADLFRECNNIFKECLLTAFSLTPTRESLQRLEDFVNNGGPDDSHLSEKSTANTENEVKIETEITSDNLTDQNLIDNDEKTADTSSLSAVTVSEGIPSHKKPINNELNAILETMGVDSESNKSTEIKTEPNSSFSSLNETMKGTAPAYITEVESMKIEDSIKTDLNSILRYQRHHTLTWDFEWPVLKENCEKYYDMFEKRGFDEVELKYLELDYNQFKNYPVEYDDSTGIEKGYEHFITHEIEESDGEFDYNCKAGYSSDDSEYNEDYGRKKRKKLRNKYDDDDDYDWRRKSTKKKRPKAKIKIEPKDEYSADSLPNGNTAENEMQLPAIKALPSKRRLRGRLRSQSISDSEANADSQSENQPPEEEEKDDTLVDGIIGDCSVKTSANNLQLLRQFRISLSRPLASEENTTNITRQLSCDESINKVSTSAITNNASAAISDLDKSTNLVFEDGDLVQLRICIPKCDGYPYFNDVQMLDSLYDNRSKNQEKLLSSKKLSDSANPLLTKKSSSIEPSKNGANSTIDLSDTGNNDKSISSSRSREGIKSYPKTSKHAKRFAVNRSYRKKLYAVNLLHSKQSAEGLDDLISEIFPEFSSNGSWQTNGDFDENFFEPPPPPMPVVSFQQPTPTLSEFLDTTLDSTLGPTSFNEATFVSSTVELPSNSVPINPVEDGSSPPFCNELTPLQPAGSPPMVQVLSSYLNSTIDSIDSMYSYPSDVCRSQQVVTMQQTLPEDDLSTYEPSTTELLDISASLAESAYSSYSTYQQQIPDDIYSMNVSSTYDVVAPPNSGCVTETASPMLAHDVHSPDVHSDDGATSAPVGYSTLKPSSKLRAALQKSNMHLTVNLPDIVQTKKSTIKEEPSGSTAVNQILDEYRDTMDKHPELGHLPARRKRAQDQNNDGNPPKRGRRSKKDSVTASSNQNYSLSSPSSVQVPSVAVESPVLGVEVPSQLQLQTLSSNNSLLMQPNQTNKVHGSESSNAMQELPSCTATSISSQSYGDDGCENEVTSAVSMQGIKDCGDGSGCAPSQTTGTYWSEDTNLINLDGASEPVNADDSCGNQLLQSNDSLHSGDQNDSATDDKQDVEAYPVGKSVCEQDDTMLGNGVLSNAGGLLYDSNFSTQANNYET